MLHQRLLLVMSWVLGSLVVGFLLLVQPALAAGPEVNTAVDENDGSCSDDCSLRDAIATATAGDTITFSGDYTITLASQLTISKNLTIDGSSHSVAISGNKAVRVFYINSGITATLQNITVADGSTDRGAGIYNDGALNAIGVTFSGNLGINASSGGGLYNNGTVVLTDTTFSSNSAFSGGALYNQGTMTLANVTFSDNSGGSGGGLENFNGTVILTNVTFNGNSAENGGGGLYNRDGTATLTNAIFSGNSAVEGGGLYNYSGTTTLTNVTFSGNSGGYGGGLRHYSGTATLTGVTFDSNRASVGGGLDNVGTATLTNVTFSSNSATWGDGGGLRNGGTATLTNVTFSGNSAEGGGGGLRNGKTATLTNVTFSGNSATYIGGGIYSYYATLILSNTLIANSSGGDCFHQGASPTGAFNLIEDATYACGLSDHMNGNIIGVDPLLSALGDYGGSTQTFALLPGSGATDAGTNCPDTDQRGVTRPQSSACDIGAFESQGFSLSYGSGSGQSAFINTAFASPLSLTVSSSEAEPVNGGQIIFTAPANGASTRPSVYTATISGDMATQVVTANATVGRYVVTATIPNDLGSAVGYTLTNQVTELAVLGNSVEIAAGDTTPATTDHTDFGPVPLGGAITRTFTLSNSGIADLTVSSLSLSGTDAADFSLTDLVLPVIVTPHHTATFQVRFTPSISGTRVTTVTITNNDIDENPYDFAVRGTGTLPRVSLLVDANSGSEVGQTVITVTATASAPVSGTQTVELDVHGSDITTEDYSLNSAVMAILDGQSSGSVTFTIQDDTVDENDEIAILTLANPSAGLILGSPTSQEITLIDDDSRGITLTESSGATAVTESGATDTYTLALSSQPTAIVTVIVNGGTQTEVRTGAGEYSSVLNLTFTDITWATPQTVEVRAVDDTVVEGDHSQNSSHSTSGGDYNNASIGSDVTVAITDNDLNFAISTGQDYVPEGSGSNTPLYFTVTRSGGITGTTAAVNFSLSGNVNMNDYTNLTPASGTVSFGSGESQKNIGLEVMGDFNFEPDEMITVTLSDPAGPGSSYLTTVTARTTITDDDEASLIITPITGLSTTEAGDAVTFTIRLNSQPTAPVTATMTSGDTSEGLVSPTLLIFTPANWADRQAVTVTGVNDLLADGDIAYTIRVGMTSSDNDYNSLDPAEVAMTNLDDDMAAVGYTLIPTSFSLVEGCSQAVSVTLGTQPMTAITITLSSSDLSECSVLPASVTLNAVNWQSGVSFTVSGMDDGLADGTQSCTIITTASTNDSTYYGLDPADVNLTVTEGNTYIYLPFIVNSFAANPSNQ